MLTVTARDGFARLARWALDASGSDAAGADAAVPAGVPLQLPEVLWPATPRVAPPPFARAVLAEAGAGVPLPPGAAEVRDAGSVFAPRGLDAGPGAPPGAGSPRAPPGADSPRAPPGAGSPRFHIPPDLPWPEQPGAAGQALLRDAQAVNAAGRGCGPGAALVVTQPDFAHDAPLAVLAHARARFAHPRAFAAAVLAARREAGPDALLYAPGLGLPHELATLAYVGVDLVDGVAAMLEARRGRFLTPEGGLDAATLEERPCACPACMDAGLEGHAWLRAHGAWAVEAELRRVREAVRAGRLRELVEVRVRAWPEGLGLLRVLDLEHHAAFALRAPATRVGAMVLGSKESLWRPEVERYRRKLADYRRPEPARVLLLAPCSARKPYSMSRTHAMIGKALTRARNVEAVHRVVFTSPLGVVPMELELGNPAANYDLPVTGHWDRDERAVVQEALAALLANNAYDRVLVHLDDTEHGIAGEVLPADHERTVVGDDPLGPKSLELLAQRVDEAAQVVPRVRRGERMRADMAARARWQFGPGAEEALCRDATVHGRYPRLKLVGPEGQRAMLTEERGLLSLTAEGARLLQPLGRFQVRIDDFRPRGSVLAPGVQDATLDIAPEDEVLVLHGGELRATGKAVVSGEDMRRMRRGEVVKVRHRV